MKKQENLCIVCELTQNCCYRFKVQVFDQNNNLKFSDIQCKSNMTNINVTEKGEYKIKITSLCCLTPRVACRWVKLNPCCKCVEYFKFMPVQKPPKIVRVNFLLTDANYTNLPIEEGVITLWPNIT